MTDRTAPAGSGPDTVPIPPDPIGTPGSGADRGSSGHGVNKPGKPQLGHARGPEAARTAPALASWRSWAARPRLDPLRHALLALGLVLLVLALVPPLTTLGARYLLAESLDYSLLFIAVPALLCAGAPWQWLGLASALQRAEARRAERHRLGHAALTVAPALAVAVAWRSTVLVDAIAHHSWLFVLEAITLVPAGLLVWIELVSSPPLRPRLAPHLRIMVAAVPMWTMWTLAYLIGMSTGVTYPAYSGRTSSCVNLRTGASCVGGALVHRAISVAADQQLTAGVMWLVATLAFMPLAFANLMTWLRRESDASTGFGGGSGWGWGG